MAKGEHEYRHYRKWYCCEYVSSNHKKIQQNKTNNILNYLNNSLNEEEGGFMLIPFLNITDIISTSCAIDLANTLSGISILKNDNISKYRS